MMEQRSTTIRAESDSTDSFSEIEERQEQLIGLTNFPCTVMVHVRSILTTSECITMVDSYELAP